MEVWAGNSTSGSNYKRLLKNHSILLKIMQVKGLVGALLTCFGVTPLHSLYIHMYVYINVCMCIYACISYF